MVAFFYVNFNTRGKFWKISAIRRSGGSLLKKRGKKRAQKTVCPKSTFPRNSLTMRPIEEKEVFSIKESQEFSRKFQGNKKV